MGIDLGPNLSVTGSLATILWLIALRRENLQVSAWSFLKVGVIVMPLALLLAGLFLGFTSPQTDFYSGEPKRSATNLCQISPKEFRQIIPKESPNTAHSTNESQSQHEPTANAAMLPMLLLRDVSLPRRLHGFRHLPCGFFQRLTQRYRPTEVRRAVGIPGEALDTR